MHPTHAYHLSSVKKSKSIIQAQGICDLEVKTLLAGKVVTHETKNACQFTPPPHTDP